MEIIVCIKQVPGTSEVEVDEETGVLKREGIDSKLNPYDLYAIETAVQLKERYGARVRVLTMGPPQAVECIEEALYMGADEGALLSDRAFAGADVLATAYTLSQGIKRWGIPDVIICGKQTTDGDTAQVGAELSEFLGITMVSNVCKILDVEGVKVKLESDWPQAIAVQVVKFPCLLTMEKGSCAPRLPSYRRKLSLGKVKIPLWNLEDFADKDVNNYGLNGSPTRVQRIFPPPTNNDREIWRGSGVELANRLVGKLKKTKIV